MSESLCLGTRGSDLALWQARHVSVMLEESLGIATRIEIIKTRGDRIQDVAFAKMEGKGFFTKELQEALLDHRVDLVVHSLKDLPTEEADGLEVVAIPERANPADLLLARKAVLGTSSLRRAAQTLALCPEIQIKALRGNVPTRIAKLREGDYDAILLAAAGVGRLELDLADLDSAELRPEVMLPAPGQGALAIECRSGDALTRPLEALHDHEVATHVTTERRLLEMLGGGCHLPLGCLATTDEAGIRLQAVLGEIDDDVTRATVARVGALAPNPELASIACFEALKAAVPTTIDP